jgi:hypothetical protein
MDTRRAVLAAAAALMVLPPLGRAAEPPPDADFLEFLGSADSDDPEWNEYVASGDIEHALSRAASTPKAPPARDAPPADKVKDNGSDDDS